MRSNTHWNLNWSNVTAVEMFIISARSPRWPFTPVREPCRAPEWKEALNMNAAEMNKFKFPFFDNPGRHYPGCHRVFFLLFAAKIEQWSSNHDELFFPPLVTIYLLIRTYSFTIDQIHVMLNMWNAFWTYNIVFISSDLSAAQQVKKQVITCQCYLKVFVYKHLFRERLSEKVHATIPKGIVGSFEFTFVQRNLKEWHERP